MSSQVFHYYPIRERLHRCWWVTSIDRFCKEKFGMLFSVNHRKKPILNQIPSSTSKYCHQLQVFNIEVAAANKSNDVDEIVAALKIRIPFDSGCFNRRDKLQVIVIVFLYSIFPFSRREIEWKVCQKTYHLIVWFAIIFICPRIVEMLEFIGSSYFCIHIFALSRSQYFLS